MHHHHMNMREKNERYKSDEHLVLHPILAVYPKSAKIKVAFQTKESFFDHVFCAIYADRLFRCCHVVADKHKPAMCAKYGIYCILADTDRVT